MKLLLLSLFSFTLLSTRAQVQEPTRTEAEAKTLINTLHEKLMKGAGFAGLADEYSEDPGTKGEGGKYENVEKGVFVPEFENVVSHLKINEISKPFKTKYGYHIVQLLKKENNKYSVRHILIMYKK